MHGTLLSGFLLFWAIFLACTALVAFLTHRYVTSTIAASALTALILVVGIALVDRIRLGYFDGWLIIAAPIAGSITFAFSFIVGALLDRLGISRRACNTTHGV